MTHLIRPVQPRDHAEWLRLRNALWPHEVAEHDAAITDFFAAAPTNLTTLVIERPDGTLGGFAEVGQRPYAEGCHTSPVGFLEGLYVDADLRRLGWARRLVAAAEDWARQQGYTEMGSDCELENRDSLAMHLALGFDEVERIICFRKALT